MHALSFHARRKAVLVKSGVYRRMRALACIPLFFSVLSGTGHAAEKFGFGHLVTPAQIAAWDINVFADGRNLPQGSGTVAQGQAIYAQQCASCHGAKGEGGTGDQLVGGKGSLASAKPIKTVGSYWPYAPTLFDYIRRAMPLTAPQSLSDEQVYAVTAYLLYMNDLVKEDTTLDAKSLAAIKMPNRDGFVGDPRPDVPVAKPSAKQTDGK